MLTSAKSTLTPWHPTADQPWNMQRVIHLLRRAGFGANWPEIQRDLQSGAEAAIDRALRPVADRTAEEFEQLSAVIGSAAVAANNIARLQAWWLFRMLRSPDPLGERLTLMWHNHFATSQTKVQDVARMAVQNNIFRENARVKFGHLLPQVIKDPALLVWLDADANRQEHPNENLAREIMELFTLGVQAYRSNYKETASPDRYTEHDVKQAARALTGWTASYSGFRFNAKTHDDGEKTIFGKCGNWDGDQFLELLLEHPATPRRLAWRICNEFMGEGCVTEALVTVLAEQLADSDLDVGKGVEILLRSKAFFDDPNIGSRVASPVEYVIGSIHALEMHESPPSTLLLAEWIGRMGQSLFHPPNVFGWPGGRSWLTTRTVIGRANFVASLVAGTFHNPARELDAALLATRNGFDKWDEQACFYSQLLVGMDCAVKVAIADKSLASSADAEGVVSGYTAKPLATKQSLEQHVVDLLRSPPGQVW